MSTRRTRIRARSNAEVVALASRKAEGLKQSVDRVLVVYKEHEASLFYEAAEPERSTAKNVAR